MKASSTIGSDWALVAATLAIIAVATLQAGRLRIDSDAGAFCSSTGFERDSSKGDGSGEDSFIKASFSENSIAEGRVGKDSFTEEKGTRVVLNIGERHWIWVSCPGASA